MMGLWHLPPGKERRAWEKGCFCPVLSLLALVLSLLASVLSLLALVLWLLASVLWLLALVRRRLPLAGRLLPLVHQRRCSVLGLLGFLDGRLVFVPGSPASVFGLLTGVSRPLAPVMPRRMAVLPGLEMALQRRRALSRSRRWPDRYPLVLARYFFISGSSARIPASRWPATTTRRHAMS